MLHSVPHGKLDESLPEPDRLKDALTSTVFGALVWTGSWDLLARSRTPLPRYARATQREAQSALDRLSDR